MKYYVLLVKDIRYRTLVPRPVRGLHADCAPSVGIPPDPVIFYIRFKRDLLATALAFRLLGRHDHRLAGRPLVGAREDRHAKPTRDGW